MTRISRHGIERASTGGMQSAVSRAAKRVLFVTDFYEEEALLGVVDHAREQGWELIANMRFHGMFPTESEADGILVTAHGARVQKWLEGWRDTPMVHLGMTSYSTDIPWVGPDYVKSGQMGAKHLLELGQVRYAFYTLEEGEDTLLIRDGFEAEIRNAGLKSVRLDLTVENGLEMPRQLRLERLAEKLRLQDRPLAVMTSDDRRSLELVAACELAGLRVPEDISILGCENRSVELGLCPTKLSSVDLNRRLIGTNAARTLDVLMSGGAVTGGALVQPKGVVARASTATFATGNPGITRSVIHLREHVAEPAKLSELAKMAGMSERYFREEFKRLVGHSPRHELLRSRMAKAARLLRDTDFKLETIAIESGMGSAKKLCEFFTRFHGMSPGRWRMQAQDSKA